MRTRDIYTVLGRLAQLDKAPDYGSGDSGFKSQGGHFFFLSVACTPVGGKPWAPSLGRPCEGSTASIVNTPLPVVVRFVLEYWSNIYIVDCFVEQRRAPNGAAISR